MPYFVYILQCSDGKLYTGYTKNLEERLKQHREGKGSRFVRSRLPVKLVYTERYGDRGEAMGREREIKKMSRQEKIELIKREGIIP